MIAAASSKQPANSGGQQLVSSSFLRHTLAHPISWPSSGPLALSPWVWINVAPGQAGRRRGRTDGRRLLNENHFRGQLPRSVRRLPSRPLAFSPPTPSISGQSIIIIVGHIEQRLSERARALAKHLGAQTIHLITSTTPHVIKLARSRGHEIKGAANSKVDEKSFAISDAEVSKEILATTRPDCRPRITWPLAAGVRIEGCELDSPYRHHHHHNRRMFNLLRRCVLHQQQHLRLLPGEAQLIGHNQSRTQCLELPSSWTTRRHNSNSAAYDGDGKTTVTVLNDDESHLNLVNTYSANGFRLHNNLFIYGSILLFPTNVFSWNVKRAKDITLESLMVFDIIVPKTKIVIIGYGQYGEDYDASIPFKLKKKGISCEMMATPNAITTYNFLVSDSVHVAGAFIPVREEPKMTERDEAAIDNLDALYKERPYLPKSNAYKRVTAREDKVMWEKTVYRDIDKKEFD